jgi:hypothetical protein
LGLWFFRPVDIYCWWWLVALGNSCFNRLTLQLLETRIDLDAIRSWAISKTSLSLCEHSSTALPLRIISPVVNLSGFVNPLQLASSSLA